MRRHSMSATSTGFCLAVALTSGCQDALRLIEPEGATPSTKSSGDSRTGSYLLWDGIKVGTGGSGGGEQCNQYNYLSPPFVWGDWKKLGTHWGQQGVTISAAAVAEGTVHTGMVSFYSPGGNYLTPQFVSSISFMTGNAIDDVYVRFYSNPFGTPIVGQVCGLVPAWEE